MSRISYACSVLARIGFVVAFVAAAVMVVTDGGTGGAGLVFFIAGPLALAAFVVHGLTLPREDEPESQPEGDHAP